MYAQCMWKLLRYAPLAIGAVVLACRSSLQQNTAAATPPAIISESVKDLYMACSAARPRSASQQKLLLEMAHEASNGKELLLVMRAAEGVFPAQAAPQEVKAERHLRGMVASKMIKSAGLDELIEYAMKYSINPEDGRPFVQRMLQLAVENPDPRIWSRIQRAAVQWNVTDLALQAEATQKELTGK